MAHLLEHFITLTCGIPQGSLLGPLQSRSLTLLDRISSKFLALVFFSHYTVMPLIDPAFLPLSSGTSFLSVLVQHISVFLNIVFGLFCPLLRPEICKAFHF